MNERKEIRFGEALADVLEDADGAIDLTGATVTLQRREDCGDIFSASASISDATSGQVTISGLPVGHFRIRWLVTIGATTTYYPAKGWDELVVRPINACNTFDLFVGQIKDTVFPEGEAENLVANHRKYIVDGLIDLQQKVPGLREKHRDRTPQADTYFECGATVISAPRGMISKVYTVTQEDCCAIVRYTPIDHENMECVLETHELCGPTIEPYPYYYEDPDYLDYPGCPYPADASGDTDFAKRPQRGWVSIKDGLLYLYPHLQSNEIAVVEWDGIKRSWKDVDEVTWDREVHDALEHYLEAKTARREDCDAQRMAVANEVYNVTVTKLIWQYRRENRIDRAFHCFDNCGPTSCRVVAKSKKT